jgi:predicted DsbA family dithiol-disulfide isomerase
LGAFFRLDEGQSSQFRDSVDRNPRQCYSAAADRDLLGVALRRFRQSDDADRVTFTVKYFPYQLYPEASKEGEDKYEWYKKSRYGDSEEKIQMYTTLMSAYGVTAGIDFKFGGTVANTIDAHRLIQHYQEEKGPEVVGKLINGCQEPTSTF